MRHVDVSDWYHQAFHPADLVSLSFEDMVLQATDEQDVGNVPVVVAY